MIEYNFDYNRIHNHYKFQIRWKSDIPLTEGQLKSKRDEFWDTAPAFEGKSEIWNALKAAVEATEVNDYDLAQGIKDIYTSLDDLSSY